MFKILGEINTKQGKCTSVAVDKKYDEIVAHSEGTIVKIFNKSELISKINSAEPLHVINTENDIVQVRINSSAEKLGLTNMDYKLEVYENSNNFMTSYEVDPGACKYFLRLVKTWKFEFHPTRNELVTGKYSLAIHDIDSGEKICDLYNEYKYAYSYAYLDNNTVAVGNATGSINIFSLETLKIKHKVEEHCLPVRTLTADIANNKVFSASDDLHINILDSTNFKVSMSLVGHRNIITGFASSNQTNLNASCSHDGTVKIWDLKMNKAIQTIRLDNSSVDQETNCLWDLTFSADGKTLFCGSDRALHILSIN
jgi:WD40 repeat protein